MLKVLKKTAVKDSLAVLIICFALTTIWGVAFFMLAGKGLNSVVDIFVSPKILGENDAISKFTGRTVTITLDAVVDDYIGAWSKDFDGDIYYLALTPEGGVISVIADDRAQGLSDAESALYEFIKNGSGDKTALGAEITGKVVAISDPAVLDKAAVSLSGFIETPSFLQQLGRSGLIKAEPVLYAMESMQRDAIDGKPLYAVDATNAPAASREESANKNLGLILTGGFFVLFLLLFLHLFLRLISGKTNKDVKTFLKTNPDTAMSDLETDFSQAVQITGKFWVGSRYTYWVENAHAYIIENAKIQRVTYFNHNAYTGKGKRAVMKLQIHVSGSKQKNEIPMLPNEAKEAMEYLKKAAPGIEAEL